MHSPSAISYLTRSGKNRKSNTTDRVGDDCLDEVDGHPPPVDAGLLGAINSESSYEAVTLLTSENTFTQDGLNQALLSACSQGHKLLVQTLVQVGANIEHRDEHGNTPLLICAGNGFKDIFQFLVSRHANVNAVNSVGNSALILSVRSPGAIDFTRFLLKQQDVDVHHENQHGHTALNRATQFMDVDTMRLLLEKSMRKKPDRECRNDSSSEYDMDSCFFTSIDQETKQQITVDKTGLAGVYDILQEHLITGTSPLELAIKAGDRKSLDMFLDCQFSSREEKTRYVDSALKYVFQNQHYSMQRFSSIDVKIIQKLLQYGADVNQGHETNLISLAVESGNFQVVELLCTHGADLKGDYSRDEDPLVIAAKLGRLDLIELLLKYKADIDRADFSDSALDYALRNDHTECAKLLIQHGARMDVKSALRSAVDHQVSKYMHFLFENYNSEIMDYFSQQPQEVRNLLTLAAKKGNCEIIGRIRDAGVGVDKADWTGQMPLMASKNREVAEFIIQTGAGVSRERESSCNNTAFSYLIKYRDCKDKFTVEVCKVLIVSGASINFRNEEDKTPLMMAAARDDCVDMLQMLLDNGADINDKDCEGDTALFHAVSRQNSKNVTCLIDCSRYKKKLINIKNTEGITPLILSVQTGNVSIVKELIGNGADVNIKDIKENTALHHLLAAFHQQKEEILTSLLKAGSHVNWQNSDGISPLMIATRKKKLSMMSSLLDAGADVNAVSKTNNSNTALSFLSPFKLIFGNNTSLCIEILLDSGARGSYLSPECIHKLIIRNQVNLILKLIEHGVGPAIMAHIQKGFRLYVGVSPLCLALLLGNVNLARYFMDILFLTCSDLSMFASNIFMESLLQREDPKQMDSLRFLKELSSRPMSLVKLSLVTVSEAVGPSPGRETRVDSLPLPQIMKDKLLFKTVGGALDALIPELYTQQDMSMCVWRNLTILGISDPQDYIWHDSDSDDDM